VHIGLHIGPTRRAYRAYSAYSPFWVPGTNPRSQDIVLEGLSLSLSLSVCLPLGGGGAGRACACACVSVFIDYKERAWRRRLGASSRQKSEYRSLTGQGCGRYSNFCEGHYRDRQRRLKVKRTQRLQIPLRRDWQWAQTLFKGSPLYRRPTHAGFSSGSRAHTSIPIA
jgi:hypothetical protein